MKAKIQHEKSIDADSPYYGSMGYGMKWNTHLAVLQRSLYIRDFKSVINNSAETIFGTLGKSRKSCLFRKEDFKLELAPKRATIEYLTINGNDYVRMRY